MADVDESVEFEDQEEHQEEGTEETSDKRKGRDWESEARGMGWNPDHDGPDSVDAREYVLRAPLFEANRKNKKKIRELEAALERQAEMTRKLLESQRDAEVNRLNAAKKQAIANSDADGVEKIDKEIADTQKKFSVPAARQIPQEVHDFTERNDWYGPDGDENMTTWADARANRLAVLEKQSGNPVVLSKILKKVEEEARQVFPHKFEKKQVTTPRVETDNTSYNDGGEKQVNLTDQLGREEKTAARTLWRRGAFGDPSKVSWGDALKKYANSYFSQGGE